MKKSLVTAAATAGLMLTAFGASASAQEITYTVRPGDSLWKISQDSHLSINQLKSLNHLANDKIYVNQKLVLTHTVKSGDSLWVIAKSYGTTVSELKKLNGLTSDLIHVGQQLKISGLNSRTSALGANTYNNGNYVVQKGDSLSMIGTRFHLSVSQLKALNHLTSDKIYAGQTLNIRSTGINVPEASKGVVNQSGADSDSQGFKKQMVTPNSPVVEKQDSKVTEKPAVPSDSAATEKTSQTTNSAEKPASTSNTQAVQKPPVSSQSVTNKKPAAPSKATTSGSNVQAIIDEAKKYIGAPYSWGGNTPAGFDCSGFTKYVFNKQGISIPRTAAAQWDAATPVNSPSVGDLVFFETYKIGPSHVGIYLGNNKFISAASTGVTISDMTSTYWKTRYLGAKSVD